MMAYLIGLALLAVVLCATVIAAGHRMRRNVDLVTSAMIPPIAVEQLLRAARTRDILWFIATAGVVAYSAMVVGQWAAAFGIILVLRAWDFVLALLALNLAKHPNAVARAAGDCLAISAADETVTIFVSPKVVARALARSIPTMKVQ